MLRAMRGEKEDNDGDLRGRMPCGNKRSPALGCVARNLDELDPGLV